MPRRHGNTKFAKCAQKTNDEDVDEIWFDEILITLVFDTFHQTPNDENDDFFIISFFRFFSFVDPFSQPDKRKQRKMLVRSVLISVVEGFWRRFRRTVA